MQCREMLIVNGPLFGSSVIMHCQLNKQKASRIVYSMYKSFSPHKYQVHKGCKKVMFNLQEMTGLDWKYMTGVTSIGQDIIIMTKLETTNKLVTRHI